MQTTDTLIYPWQQTQWQRIMSAVSQNRLHHSLLIHGEKGLGKNSFALALGKFLLCQQKNKMQISCEVCSSCHHFTKSSHPDFYKIIPETDGKTIKIDQIRQAINSLQQTTNFGGYRVMLITPTESLTTAAANALLKTLEEPPIKESMIILIAEKLHFIPATIRSRCQLLDFKVPPKEITINWLKEKISAEEIDWELLLTYAPAPLASLHALNNNTIALGLNLLSDLVNLLADKINPITLAKKWEETSVEILHSWVFLWLRAVFICKQSAQHLENINAQTKNHLITLAKQIDSMKILELIDKFLAMRSTVCEKIPLNQQLQLECFFWQWKKG